jgi:glycosyltransferase involved in cell wall biosynthesis
MHVVMVVPGGVDRSGEVRVIPALLWLIEGLAARHRVSVVALGQEPTAARWPLLGATVHNVPSEPRGPVHLGRQLARAMRAIGDGGRPDVVHGMWASVSGLAAVMGARRHRVPSVIHVGGGELVDMPEIGYGGARGRGGPLITATTLRQAGAVTVASRWMADHVRRHGHRVDAVIPLGVDTNRFRPAAPNGSPPTPRPYRLVSVADLNAVKDHGTLLRALGIVRARWPDLEVELIGTDTRSGATAWLADALDVPVHFTGYVPSAELPAHLQRADLHVMSARHDAGPVAVLEAAACGLATVGTRVGHIADLAAADPPGAVAVAPQRPDELAEAIIAVLADPAWRAGLAGVARSFALDHDRHATVEAFDRLYHRLRASS